MAKDKAVSERRDKAPAPAGTGASLERFFEDFFQRRWLQPFDWPAFADLDEVSPRVDIIDRDREVVVRAAMPGLEKDDIELSVSGTTLTLKGSHRQEENHEDGDYHRREIVSRFTARTVSLPCEVDGDQARAKLKDGMLEVTLPKVETGNRKRIAVEG